ncbi:MAG: UDP-4-amino-4,6-dideoxy-N-acetyl-beta-L-altrosamine transaminase [Rhizomicrobium sp.]
MHIPYGRQSIDEADIAAVVRVLKSDFLTQGSAVPAFEQALAKAVGARHGVAVQNATCALHIACLALGVGPGDLVWTSPNSFVASANCARYCGAEVDFVDIDPVSFNMSVKLLAEKFAAAKKTGRLPKVIIPVHFAGQSCDMAEIRAIAHEYGAKVIEDAAHAVGGTYRNGRIGGCEYADIAVFSFHPVKIITTGEGGMAMTNDDALAQRMADLRSHGITRDPARLTRSDEGAWYYEQHALGFNYRMTEMQAALGLSQLSHLDAWIARRNAIARAYDGALAGLPLILPKVAPGRGSAWHLYVVQLAEGAKLSRREFFDAMRARGIGVNVHYIPIPWQPDFQRLGFERGQFPAAERYYERAVSLPMYAGLTDTQFDTVVGTVRELLG